MDLLLKGLFLYGAEFLVFGSKIISGEDFFCIGVEGNYWGVISECSDGGCGIFSNSGEREELLMIIGEYVLVLCVYDVGTFENISGSGVVSESLIKWEELFVCALGEVLYRGVLMEDVREIFDDSGDLGLLEEDF